MRFTGVLMAGIAASLLASGCATGPSFQEVAQTMPPLRADEGRVFFFRSSSPIGAAIQPELRIDEEVVGRSRPGGFFYADRKPGSYVAAGTTEVETTRHFKLAAGETRYLRSSITFGVLAGRLQLSEEDEANARGEMASLSYTGEWPVPAMAAATGQAERQTAAIAAASAPAPVQAPADAVAARGTPSTGAAAVQMDDLRYLLQPR